MNYHKKIGVIIVNLGTPSSPTVQGIRAFLRQLLDDPNVLAMPTLFRKVLLYGLILPFRPKRLVEPYQSIWMEEGSPFLVYTNRLRRKLEDQLGANYYVLPGLQCGEPSVNSAMQIFRQKGIQQVLAIPMYPQYAVSTTGSAIRQIKQVSNHFRGPDWNMTLRILPPFYARQGYINSLVSRIQSTIQIIFNSTSVSPDILDKTHILFSYHGLPVKHILKSGTNCMHSSFNCCKTIDDTNAYCYRAQCLHTTQQVAKALELETSQYTMSFQSRLGRGEWLTPATTQVLSQLPKRGIKDLIVVTPSFTTDCLETLEEIAVQGKQIFITNGGRSFHLTPCLNDFQPWVSTLANWIQELS